MTLRSLTTRLLGLIAIAATSGCSEENDPTSEIAIYDIVAFRGQDSGRSEFTIQKPRSTEVITLTAQSAVINTNLVNPGKTVRLVYIPDGHPAYTSGPVTVKGYYAINNDKMREMSHAEIDNDSEDAEPVYLLSAWRSETFLNLHVNLPYDNNARMFTLVRDLDSPDPAFPDLYLIHKRITPAPTFDRTYFVSYDISDLMADPAVSGFTLRLDNSNLPVPAIPFSL